MYAFTVPGNPLPKARPRFYRGHAITDPATMRAEQLVVMAARRAKVKPLEGNLVVEIWFFRDSKRRCDWDNLAKLTCDALNGIAWDDDDQVVDAFVHKRIDREHPRTEIRIRPANQVELVMTAEQLSTAWADAWEGVGEREG